MSDPLVVAPHPVDVDPHAADSPGRADGTAVDPHAADSADGADGTAVDPHADSIRVDPPAVDPRAAVVIAALRGRGQTVATAESLTAGLCCATLVSVPGASVAVRGGLIAYATDLKHTLAGVPADVLTAHGPVSGPTAAHLAAGAAEKTGSDWGVGLTGVAGPEPQDGQPAGTVWVATSYAGHNRSRLLHIDGDRPRIRQGAVAGALELLAEHLADVRE